jgi:hypothetical protein
LKQAGAFDDPHVGWIEYDGRIVVKKLLKKQGHPFTR